MVINPIVGVYIPIIRIPIKGGMTIPDIATFDHGTYHTLGCPPSQDASHHQDYEPFLGSGDPELNLHLPQASWEGGQPKSYTRFADLSPKNIFGNNPPQMVPMDINIGFQGLALIQESIQP